MSEEAGEGFPGSRVMEEVRATGLRAGTTDYARRIIRLYRGLPKEVVPQTLGRQLLRSGTSVGANYREAVRGRSTPEFIAKAGDCLRELDESAYWLELLAEEPGSPPARLAPSQTETGELIAIFITVLLQRFSDWLIRRCLLPSCHPFGVAGAVKFTSINLKMAVRACGVKIIAALDGVSRASGL